jgi:hypothetical protein
MRNASIVALRIWLLLGTIGLLGATPYQTGKLLSISDARSNRDVQNTYNGSITTVTDVEYRFSIRIGEIIYVASYWPRTRWSYKPTDFIVNDPIEVRLDGKHMFIKRTDGKEFKTDIVQRIRAEQKP